MHASFSMKAVILVALSCGGGCFRGECGGDTCPVSTPVSTYVAGRVTSSDGDPVAGLRVESRSATLIPGTGCDTTAMQSWNQAETGPTGSYVLSIDLVGFDEEDCSFIRIAAAGNPGFAWNDTLVGPLALGEFGAEPPDTARVDIVLQPAAQQSSHR